MPVQAVPPRLRRVAALLDVPAGASVLEVGCGPGALLSLLCADPALAGCSFVAVDRSATAVRRARERNAAHVGAGRLAVEHVGLAAAPPRLGRRFDVVVAVDVNAFWVDPLGPDVAAIASLLAPGGTVQMFFSAPTRERAAEVARRSAAGLEEQGHLAVVAVEDLVASVMTRPRG